MRETYSMENLVELIQSFSPTFLDSDDNARALDALTLGQRDALTRVVQSEISGHTMAMQRGALYHDLCQFDLELNALFSRIISSRIPAHSVQEPSLSGLFARNEVIELSELDELRTKGYRLSHHEFTQAMRSEVFEQIADCQFVNRGIFSVEMNGAELLRHMQNGSIEKYIGANGDTFWIKDQNDLAQKAFFQKLAFDPYILSIAASYLGCVPIHVQTNIWFSFPTFQEKNNLSTNAQMFHQDKEFIKFIKLFIYLSDVGEENGPHV